MREHRQKAVAAIALGALVLISCAILGLSSVGAANQSESSVRGKGLGDAKPIEIQGKADTTVHVNSGWMLFLVGTNRYDNMEDNDLSYAVKDVEALKKRFIELGVPQENITILTSESRGKLLPEKKNIEAAFQRYIASLEKGDCAFVYLSGHGFRFDRDKRAFYAPRNVDVSSKASIIETSVSIDAMIADLRNSAANLKWMTVDACRNDPTKYMDDEPTATDKDMKAIGVARNFIVDSGDLPDSFIFMQGCKDGQCSIESPELEQGIMTYSLLEALQYDDNPADPQKKFELKLVDLLSYVQSRTEELAGRCHDKSNRPCVQSPAITNDRLQNTIFLKDLRHEGLAQSQWMEIADFENYLDNNDFGRAEDALLTIADFFPEGDNAQKYKELNERLLEKKRQIEIAAFEKYLEDNDIVQAEKTLVTLAGLFPEGDQAQLYYALNVRLQIKKRQIEKDDELAQKKKEAEDYYEYARKALEAKEYASALRNIDGAIERYNDSRYKSFRSGVLTDGIKGAVEDALIAGNVQKAESLNELLEKLDSSAAKKNDPKIAALKKPVETNPTTTKSDNPGSISGKQQVTGAEGSKAGDLKTIKIAGVEVNFCWIPAGTFTMGSPESENGHFSWEN